TRSDLVARTVIFKTLKFYFMARIPRGILGGVSGTVGTVVGGNWKGIEYIRGKSVRRSGTVTQNQEIQRTKFKMLTSFLLSLGKLLLFSFHDFAVNQTGRNYAVAYNMENGIKGQFPNLELDYPKILVSKGN